MAMDFPVSLVDRLPIFPDEACSAAALMELVGAAGRGEVESGNGSRRAVVCGFGGSSRVQAATMCYEEASVAAGGGAISCFSEGEGDNAESIEHGFTVPPVDVDREAVIQDRTESADGGSAKSTGKVDPQAPGWTKRGNL